MTGATTPTRRPQHPTAAYVHVPFCRHRCGYCNFTLIAGRDDLISGYLDALEWELALLETPRLVETIFLGGGTPSHLPPGALRRLLRLVEHWFPFTAGGEFTIEANPLDLTNELLHEMDESAVTRISLGVQSFQAEKLRLLERDHSGEDVRLLMHSLADRERWSTSLDLIFGAPGESLEDWSLDLDEAVSLRPDDISLYGLTFERGTSFWSRRLKGELRSQEEEAERAMYLAAIDRLTAAGYEHYETSNFALPGHRCRHNETYWAAHAYYGVGPGAARYVDGVRSSNHRSTTTWLAPTARRSIAGRRIGIARTGRQSPGSARIGAAARARRGRPAGFRGGVRLRCRRARRSRTAQADRFRFA